MNLIVKKTNSYAFRTNSASNPWKTLLIQELYHFFGCLIKLGLFKHPPHFYSWSSSGVLAQVLLSKNRFESILRNFHFKDRGLNPISGNWWDKLKFIFFIIRLKCFLYWIFSTNFTVDEIMIKFEKKTTQKIIIFGKLIFTGFKIFVLKDSGYIYYWECTRPGLAKSFLVEKKCISISIPNSEFFTYLNFTQSVVICLIKCFSLYIEKKLFLFYFSIFYLFVGSLLLH